jgi:hypothetical protein
MIKHKAKEAAKSLAGIQKESAAILAKLTPVLASITALTEGAEFALVAAPVVDPLLDMKAKMDCAMAAATATMACSDLDDVPEGNASLKDVMEWIASSKKVIALITNMLAMIARAARG